MSIWNPFAFTPTGQAMAPVAPPALRVIGGQATAQQLTHAQDAFYRFCASTRLSAVPNPVETGRLPDGTPYRIVVVGAMTTMTLWPAEAPRRASGKPGIGVVVAGAHWILRPPGEAMAPSAKQWAAERVPGLSGGVGATYRIDDKQYFVEGGGGISRGNKRLADPLFSMPRSIYTYPWSSHSGVLVSDPILLKGSLEQLKLVGATLSRRARKISGTELDGSTGGEEESDYLLPALSAGERWGLLTAHADKKKIVACRVSDDIGSWLFGAANIRQSVEMWRDGSGTYEVVTKSHTPSVARQYPGGAGTSAPKYTRWERDVADHYKTIYYTYSNPGAFIPGAPQTVTAEGADRLFSSNYRESCDYSATATFRRYADFTGEIREDTIEYEDRVDLAIAGRSGYYGFDTVGYASAARINTSSTVAKVTRAGTLTLFGVQPIKAHEFSVDLTAALDGNSDWSNIFSEYSDNGNGGIKGFIYRGSASAALISSTYATVKYALEHVLMHDSQFGVAVTVRAAANTTTNAREGFPRYAASSDSENFAEVSDLARGAGDAEFPQETFIRTDSRTDDLSVEMIFYGPGGKTPVAMSVPPTVRADLLAAMKALVKEVGSFSNRGSSDTAVESGVQLNNFLHESSVHAVLERVLGYATEVSYSKDPKTGAGFFSCAWNDGTNPVVRRNEVVGPWGWAPAASKTPIASNAVVSSSTSV